MSNSYVFVDPSYDDFLKHSGTKGQKWYVRNYENYDGTLTPAGKERYSVYWKSGTNLKGKKVHYGDERSVKDKVRKALNIGTARYEKPDGSLSGEGKKKYGDILTRKEMKNLVRNYNLTNGTKYKVGEVSFKKNGKYYTPEGKRYDPETKLEIPGDKTLKKAISPYKQQVASVKDMSDKELQKGIDRARLERDYIRETGIHKSRGEQFLDNLKTNAANAASDIAKDAMRDVGKAFMDQIIKPKLYEAAGLQQRQQDEYAKAKKDAQYEWDRLNALKYKQQREAMEKKATEGSGGNQNPQQPQQPKEKGQPQQKGQEQQQGQAQQEKKPKK